MRGYWARDDPAFLLILCLFLTVSAMCYGGWLRLPALGFFLAWLWTIFGDCLGSGAFIATALWLVSSRVLTRQPSSQRVEWAYCFDVHLNAFVPIALAIFGIQAVLYPLLSAENVFSLICANTLWLAAIAHYVYITFLGYTMLPSSRHTMALLYAVLPPLLLYLFSLPLRWNFALTFGSFYALRTGSPH